MYHIIFVYLISVVSIYIYLLLHNTILIYHGVNDTIDVIKKGIHGWAGYIVRFKDNRWTKRVTEWAPR